MSISENRQMLIDALLSGDYKQCRRALKTSDGTTEKYCPWGLACELYRQANPDVCSWKDHSCERGYTYKSYFVSDDYEKFRCSRPSPAVVEFFGFCADEYKCGLGDCDVCEIIYMGDGGMNSFVEIAERIKQMEVVE